MPKLATALFWICAAIAIAACVYAIVGGWQVSRTLQSTLSVGEPTAQSSGWPTPRIPADIGYKGDPLQAYGYAFDNVSLQGELGNFPAWLIPAPRGSARSAWAIFVHGIGGRRENGYRFLPTLQDAGLPVLMISYRNDTDAPADPSGLYTFGLTEWRDLDTAVAYARQNGATSVIVIAESMGGGIVGQFLRRSEAAGSVSALVLDAPAIDFEALLTSQIAKMNLPFSSLLARAGLWFSGMTAPVRLGEANTTDEIAAFSGPLFLSHGFADSVVPVASSDDLVDKRGSVTEYLRTAADHIQSWKIDPARYDGSLDAFLAALDQAN